ncbi:hypothetical protein BXT89_16295 [Halopseudomonas pachastrellae]|uniref:Uncharacterized protein n=1 Tax=Halopseudomonas pachastrellae TaxID=254161 RepID=A0A1S8DBF6_9GAMM|nr:hypothetical protein [Halopseudomonas pachastrellae]ONM42768.1 hypothetical protein BXT89_16295 [Halopseudomonas pachastrellae]SFM66826.1 hypothetical protein SAMN05216256_11715 [Halopseudomonas pachastrellae]
MPNDLRSSFSSFFYAFMQVAFAAALLFVLWLDAQLEPDQSVFLVVQSIAVFSLVLSVCWLLVAVFSSQLSGVLAGIRAHPWGHAIGVVASAAMFWVAWCQVPI